MILPECFLSELRATQTYLIKYNINHPNIPLDFWQYDDIDIIEDGFYELSESLPPINMIRVNHIPYGFFLASLIFSWECQRASEGLRIAFINLTNMSPNFFTNLIQCYQYINLNEEATAIDLAYQTWLAHPDNESLINTNYRTVTNLYSEDYERIPYIVNFLIEQSNRLFYLTDV